MPLVQIHILEGRPKEQHHRLISEVTEVVARILESPPERIRVCITEVNPDCWGIGGIPASIKREAEISRRAMEKDKGK